MSGEKRGYKQFCGTAKALDVVGERWTLLIVRNLLLGPRRYSELMAELPGITTNLLAKRLKELSEHGLIEEADRRDGYQLTVRGAALEPVVIELARWGSEYMQQPGAGERVDIGWALLSLKARYRPPKVFGTLELDIDQRAFSLMLAASTLYVREAKNPHADAMVQLTARQFVSHVVRGHGLSALVRSGKIAARGELSLIQAFETSCSA